MSTTLRFLGVAGYEIVGPTSRILIDPYLTGNPGAPCGPDDLAAPDVILVTHAAWDHMGDTLAIALRTGAPVVCGADVQELLLEQGIPQSQIRATIWGIQVEVGGVLVRPVECHHWSMARLSDGSIVTGAPLGFVVETEPDLRIYHFGDSAVFGDMRLIGELHRPTVGILGCAQPRQLLPRVPGAGRMVTGEMNPTEAALAANLLGVDIAVATHYLEPSNPDVVEFLRLVKERDGTGRRQAIAPKPGDLIVIQDGQCRVETP